MASIAIRNLDDSLKSRRHVQAAVHGRSMEDEARDILRAALNLEPRRPKAPGTAIDEAIRRPRNELGHYYLAESFKALGRQDKTITQY